MATALTLTNIPMHIVGIDGFPPSFARFFRLLDLNGERNIPALFSTALLSFVSMLSFLISVFSRQQHDLKTPYWTVLASGFGVMALDEFFSFHERTYWILRAVGLNKLGPLGNSWVWLGIPIVAVVGWSFRRFLRELSLKTRRRFLASGLAFIAGAIGFEIVGKLFVIAGNPSGRVFAMITEETLEMLGVIVFIWALLKHIDERFGGFGVRFCRSTYSQNAKENLL